MLTPLLESFPKTLSVGVLGSGGGSNLRALLSKESPLYQISWIMADRECGCLDIARAARLPHRLVLPTDHSILAACQELPPVDLLFLAGYMRLVGTPLIARYPILNIHPADLAPPRRYIGLGAIKQALRAGERRTRSSVILVDESIDGGPLLVSGPWVPYSGELPPSPDSIKQHQEVQKSQSDWPAAVAAVELVARGGVETDQNGKVFIHGRTLGASGLILQESEPCVVY